MKLSAAVTLVAVGTVIGVLGGCAKSDDGSVIATGEKSPPTTVVSEALTNPATPTPTPTLTPTLSQTRVVRINRVVLDEGTLAGLEAQLGWEVGDGAYWYDAVLGAVGVDGQPTAGFIPAGLPLGGPLPADASNGTTGVFLNGRELPTVDLMSLEQLFGAAIAPGYYVLDAQGNYGYAGGPVLGNVFTYLQDQQQSGGGGYLEETQGGWVGSDGASSYYFDSSTGCSVLSGEGVSC